MTWRHFGAGLALALLAAPPPAAAQRVLTPEEWRADLRHLAVELPRRHREPFRRISRAAFDSAVADLDARIPRLSDHAVMVGLARVVALLQDGHTRLTLPQDPAVGYGREHTPTEPPRDSALFFRHLPVRLDLFSDGLFVRAATPEHRGLIGARVLEVGRMPADSAVEAVRPVVHYDTEMGFRFMAPVYLAIPEVLAAQGIAPEPGRVRLLVQERGGAPREVVLAPVPLFRAPAFVEAREVGPAPVPLHERDLAAWYRMEFLRPGRALYVQVNRVGNAEGETMLEFARRVERTVRDSAAERVVLDLRHNAGGDNSTARPLIHVLSRDDAVNRFGRLFVLIGRETFSAAQNLVNDLEWDTQALFVGEPTGNAPNQYGDSRRFRLPNSGLTVRASTVYWRARSGSENRPATEPEIRVPVASADYFANRDPVLEAALGFRAPADRLALAREVYSRAGWGPAQRVCFAHSADPRLPPAEVEAGLTACGFVLLDGGRAEMAAQWFRMNLGFLPRSARAHAGLARALAATGKPDEAREALRRALALDPADPEARSLAGRLGT